MASTYMDYNHIPKSSGVYMITNLSNDKQYVGFSKNMRFRIQTHLRNLVHGTHPCKSMQADWITNSFCWKCEVLELTEDKLREEFWTYKQRSHLSGYNLDIGRYVRGETVKSKISSSSKGKPKGPFTKEHRQHLKDHSARKGKPGTFLGHHHTEETKQKMSEAKGGYTYGY